MNHYTSDEECPECESNDIIENWKDGTKVCRSCGVVLKQNLYDEGEEWRTFEEDGDKSRDRAGPSANNLQEHQEATDIGKKRSKADGATAYNVIRAINRQKQGAKASRAERFVAEAISEIEDICSQLELPQSMSNTAKELYRTYRHHLDANTKSDQEKRAHGRPIRAAESKAIAAASIFLACRLHRASRTLSEISRVTEVAKKNLGRTMKRMEQRIKWAKSPNSTETGDVISRWCDQLRLSQETARYANELATAVKAKEGVYGKPYTTIAATVIFVISQRSIHERKPSEELVGQVTGVSPETIKKAYRVISPLVTDSLPGRFKGDKTVSAERKAPTSLQAAQSEDSELGAINEDAPLKTCESLYTTTDEGERRGRKRKLEDESSPNTRSRKKRRISKRKEGKKKSKRRRKSTNRKSDLRPSV